MILSNLHEVPTDQYYNKKVENFYQHMAQRRTIREFTSEVPDIEIINKAILAAGTAPNGANKQPWHFAVINNPQMKQQIRVEAEKVEKNFYDDISACNQIWLNDLKHLGTNYQKPFLTSGATLIVISAKLKELNSNGTLTPTYYPIESTCIATGILITALHTAGLATLTHTPKPMRFLNELLDLPQYYRPLILLVTGYAKKPLTLPDITKKNINEISSIYS